MTKEVRDAFRIHYKWTVLRYAEITRSVLKACRAYEVPKSTFYEWKNPTIKVEEPAEFGKNLLS